MASKLGSPGSFIALGLLVLVVIGILSIRKNVNNSDNRFLKGAMRVGDTFTLIRFILFIPIILIIILLIVKSKH